MSWILGAGVVAVGLTVFENHVLRSGDIEKAELINLFGNMVLLGGALVLSWYLFSGLSFLYWLR